MSVTSTGKSTQDVDSELYSQNPIPALSILNKKPKFSYKLIHENDSFDVNFWRSDEFENFYHALKNTLTTQEGDLLLFTKVSRQKRPKEYKFISDVKSRPMLITFMQEGNRYTFVNASKQSFTALLVDSSASLETGEKNQRSTGYVLLRDLMFD